MVSAIVALSFVDWSAIAWPQPLNSYSLYAPELPNLFEASPAATAQAGLRHLSKVGVWRRRRGRFVQIRTCDGCARKI